ncbi:MAG: RodZ domain-containing protein [Erythrobacter sp.]|uniref:helix-turn-helix domain-containing protein n=1 Tax=Erythrobacter sp. TaxID=1042 RepID=UPI003C710583
MTSRIEFIDADNADTDEVVGGEETMHTQDSGPATAGALLRDARESKGVDLSHIAAETRIPIRHLESIETGRYDALPSRTYAIGFSKNYARAVGLDREEIADMVRAELADGHQAGRRHDGKMEPGDPAKLPSNGLVWFGGIAALILAIGVVAFYSTYFGAGSGPPPLAGDTEGVVPEPAGEGSAEQLVAGETAGPSADGPVVFTAIEDNVWVRFYEPSGERLFEATMQEGDTFEIPADAQDPLINTGRPHLLTITIDGQQVEKLADEQTTMGDIPVSADALLSREDEAQPTASQGDGAG